MSPDGERFEKGLVGGETVTFVFCVDDQDVGCRGAEDLGIWRCLSPTMLEELWDSAGSGRVVCLGSYCILLGFIKSTGHEGNQEVWGPVHAFLVLPQ